MAQWLQVLACNHKDLSSDPGSHGMLMSPVTLSSEGQAGGSLWLPGCQESQGQKLLVQGDCLKEAGQ